MTQQNVAQHLLTTIEAVLPLLRRYTDEEASIKPNPEKWSKKEIMGHLIDSACNNQQKFIRTQQAERHLDFVGYAQNFWVDVQEYNKANWSDIIEWWYQYNRHLAHIICHAHSEKLNNTISIEGAPSFTLAFIMSDYVEHLKHHLKQALPDLELESSFQNVYGA
jgi:hypothetical protein